MSSRVSSEINFQRYICAPSSLRKDILIIWKAENSAPLRIVAGDLSKDKKVAELAAAYTEPVCSLTM